MENSVRRCPNCQFVNQSAYCPKCGSSMDFSVFIDGGTLNFSPVRKYFVNSSSFSFIMELEDEFNSAFSAFRYLDFGSDVASGVLEGIIHTHRSNRRQGRAWRTNMPIGIDKQPLSLDTLRRKCYNRTIQETIWNLVLATDYR